MSVAALVNFLVGCRAALSVTLLLLRNLSISLQRRLKVDRQTKSSYETYEAAEAAGMPSGHVS